MLATSDLRDIPIEVLPLVLEDRFKVLFIILRPAGASGEVASRQRRNCRRRATRDESIVTPRALKKIIEERCACRFWHLVRKTNCDFVEKRASVAPRRSGLEAFDGNSRQLR